jgi:hypothetical protein
MRDLPAFLDDLSLPENLPDLRLDQIPAEVQTEDDLARWKLCVGIMWKVAQRPDWNFALELYRGSLPTGNADEIHPTLLDD